MHKSEAFVFKGWTVFWEQLFAVFWAMGLSRAVVCLLSEPVRGGERWVGRGKNSEGKCDSGRTLGSVCGRMNLALKRRANYIQNVYKLHTILQMPAVNLLLYHHIKTQTSLSHCYNHTERKPWLALALTFVKNNTLLTSRLFNIENFSEQAVPPRPLSVCI